MAPSDQQASRLLEKDRKLEARILGEKDLYLNRPSSPSGKPYIQPKREIPAEEQITLEPELEEALAHATDAEMCDIAGGQCGKLGRVGRPCRGPLRGVGLAGKALNQGTGV